MKEKDCQMDVVVALDSSSLPLERGKIVSPVTLDAKYGYAVIVEWSGGFIQRVSTRSLISEDEANKKEEQFLKKESKLEKEFETIGSKIKEKLDQAAALINSAVKLGHPHHLFISEMYDENEKLSNAIDNAGWSTSNQQC